LFLPALLAMGCGGNGNGAGGDETGQQTTVAPAGEDPNTADPASEEPGPNGSVVEDASDAASRFPRESASSEGPSLDFTIPGDDVAEGDGSESDSNASVTGAIFNSILRGAQGASSDADGKRD